MAVQKNSRSDLIRLLSDGELHSGEALAKELRCTRAAVWKQLGRLRTLGLKIDSERGRGYRIAQPIELLQREQILHHLDEPTRAAIESLQIEDVMDSTSERLRSTAAPAPGKMRVALAEYQTGGRGRRGRQWFSPFASGLCLSVSWHYSQPPSALSGLSLAAGVAVLSAMQAWCPQGLGLKWPNDLVVGDRKLAGLLVDMDGEMTGPIKLVVGVGVNLESPEELAEQVAESSGMAPIGLRDVASDTDISRNELAASLIGSLFAGLTDYGHSGFDSVADTWRSHDALYDRTVSVQQGDDMLRGVAKGVSDDGSLQLSINGKRVSVVSGEVTVRASA